MFLIVVINLSNSLRNGVQSGFVESRLIIGVVNAVESYICCTIMMFLQNLNTVYSIGMN